MKIVILVIRKQKKIKQERREKMTTGGELMKLEMVRVCGLAENYMATPWVKNYHKQLLQEIVMNIGELMQGGKITVSDGLESTKRNYFMSHFIDWTQNGIAIPFMPPILIDHFSRLGLRIRYYTKIKHNQTFYRILVF